MFSKPYVRKLSDTIISNQPLSYDQLFFLVDVVADYMFEYDYDCYDDFYRAKLSLMEKAAIYADDDRK